MTIKDYRESLGMSRAEMARVFEIPLRTLEDWEAGRREPAPWAEKLLIEKMNRMRKEKIMMKLKGIDKVVAESNDIGNEADPRYLQINLDTATGEVWTNLLSDFGCNSVVRYHDKNVINCGSLDRPADEWYVRYLIEKALEEEI